MAIPRQASAYLREPAAIYRASFAAIRKEAAIDRLPSDLQPVAVRLIHACGMTDIIDDLAYRDDVISAAQTSLKASRAILTDATMVAAGIQKQRLLWGNDILCTLHYDETSVRAKTQGITRSAAAVDLWRPHLEGAIVAIGNAPTALFRLLELLDEGAPRPAVILGFPVGFIGAAESKDALVEKAVNDPSMPPFIALRGRRGGSALAAAAVNALLRLVD